jgi:hypothetical protein
LWLVKNEDFIERMKSDPDYYDVKVAGWWVWGLCQWIGRGWCSKPEWKQLPHLGAGMGVHRSTNSNIYEYFNMLAARLRRVRVCCGDWARVMGPTPTEHNGLTAIILDPPYGERAGRAPGLYAVDSLSVADDVREWAIDNGDNPKLRIALFGYEDEHIEAMPSSWECLGWKTSGGYASRSPDGNGIINKHKERIWFSPHCLKPERISQLSFDISISL